MNKALGFGFALLAAAGLSACASDEQNVGLCPAITVLSEASRFIEFDGGEAIENVAYSGEILNASGSCRYFDDKPIVAELEVDMAFGKGPKGVDERHTFEYFVAVTRTDLVIIEKQVFPVDIRFKDDKAAVRDRIKEIVIPRASDRVSGTNFEIIVGFQISPTQANYNRSGRSLKFPKL